MSYFALSTWSRSLKTREFDMHVIDWVHNIFFNLRDSTCIYAVFSAIYVTSVPRRTQTSPQITQSGRSHTDTCRQQIELWIVGFEQFLCDSDGNAHDGSSSLCRDLEESLVASLCYPVEWTPHDSKVHRHTGTHKHKPQSEYTLFKSNTIVSLWF